jgi:hypothetical protein
MADSRHFSQYLPITLTEPHKTHPHHNTYRCASSHTDASTPTHTIHAFATHVVKHCGWGEGEGVSNLVASSVWRNQRFTYQRKLSKPNCPVAINCNQLKLEVMRIVLLDRLCKVNCVYVMCTELFMWCALNCVYVMCTELCLCDVHWTVLMWCALNCVYVMCTELCLCGVHWTVFMWCALNCVYVMCTELCLCDVHWTVFMSCALQGK